MLQNPIDCMEKCDLKKNKSTKKTSSIDEDNNLLQPVDVTIKENKFKALFKKNHVSFYIAILSLFFVFISIFFYFYF
jgi:hypothetical protein